jgi:hypothetical protein
VHTQRVRCAVQILYKCFYTIFSLEKVCFFRYKNAPKDMYCIYFLNLFSLPLIIQYHFEEQTRLTRLNRNKVLEIIIKIYRMSLTRNIVRKCKKTTFLEIRFMWLRIQNLFPFSSGFGSLQKGQDLAKSTQRDLDSTRTEFFYETSLLISKSKSQITTGTKFATRVRAGRGSRWWGLATLIIT